MLKSKRTQNEKKILGKIDDVIIKDLKSKGIDIRNNDLVITDKVILKYLNHAKSIKGAAIDLNRFADVEKLAKNPTNIYEDLQSKTLIYAYTRPYDDKVLKVIIHPNYTLKGNIFNLLKSIGIIDESKITESKQYLRIK